MKKMELPELETVKLELSDVIATSEACEKDGVLCTWVTCFWFGECEEEVCTEHYCKGYELN